MGRKNTFKKAKWWAKTVLPTFAGQGGLSWIHAIFEHEPRLSYRIHPPLSIVTISHVRVTLVAKKSPLSFHLPEEVLLDYKNTFRG